MGQVSRQKNLTGNTTIRRRLFFLLYILLIPILSVQLLIYRDRVKDLSNSALRSNMEVARAAATSAYSFIQNIALYQRGISFLLSSRNSLKVEPTQSLLDEIPRLYPDILEISLINPDGCVVASSSLADVGKELSGSSYYREILGGKNWAVGEAMHSQIGDSAFFTVSSAVRDESGALIGIIAASVDGRRLEKALSYLRYGDGDLTILDNTGRAVYRHPPSILKWEERDFKGIDPQVIKALYGYEIMEISSNSFDKKSRIRGMSPIPGIGWVSRASVPEAYISSLMKNKIYRDAGLFILVVAGSFIAAVFFSRNISEPLKKLRIQAQLLEEGEWAHPISFQVPREIGDLADTFNSMAEEIRLREEALQKHRNELSIRVEERTVELDSLSKKLRELAHQLIKAEAGERMRIARILHDDLQQFLVAAKMRVEAFAQNADSALKQELEKGLDLIVLALRTSRTLTKKLSHPVLEHEDLNTLVKWVCDSMHETHGIEVSYQWEEQILIHNRDIRLLLLQSLQELLFNVVKHAGTLSADIQVRRENDRLLLTLRDGGAGFEMVEVGPRCDTGTGLGLFAIQERLSYFGGSLNVESALGHGTVCTLLLFLEDVKP